MKSHHSTWQLPIKDKKLVIGAANKVLASGPTPGDPDSDDEKKTPEHVEPVFFHNFPYEFNEDLIRDLGTDSIIDLTPEQGTRAMVAIKLGLKYCGVTFNEAHTNGIMQHLDNEVIL